jgi:photosystem II stability/assembly factor-like uncharacterized protein
MPRPTTSIRSATARRSLPILGLLLFTLAFALALACNAMAIAGRGSTLLPPGSGWVTRYQKWPLADDLYGVAFSDATHGWVVGVDPVPVAPGHLGAILATTDGGATWSRQDTGTSPGFNAAACTDASHCWAVGWDVGGGGGIFATTDGGASWGAQLSGAATDLTAVAFADEDHGWAVGTGGVVLSTANGGADWSTHNLGTSDDLAGVAFPDALHGWTVSGTWVADTGYIGAIFTTTDGGQTWSTQVSGVRDAFTGVAFPDASHGWAVTFGGKVYATADGGATWTVKRLGRAGDCATAVAFPDATHGWAVGGTEIEPWGVMIWVTTDGGATWKLQEHGGGSDEGLTAVAFSDATHGCVVGRYGVVCTTATGGRPPVTLELQGLRHAAIVLGGHVTATGAVIPPLPADGNVRLTVQKQRGTRWTTAERHTAALTAADSYRWNYRPARKGTYRIKAAIGAAVDHPAAMTVWRTFKVK